MWSQARARRFCRVKEGYALTNIAEHPINRI
jgi:hypothetical protein